MNATRRIEHPNHITTGATSAAQAAALVANLLLARDPQPPNEVKTGATENAWSVALVLNSAILLEAWAHRLRYFVGRDGSREPKKLRLIEWLNERLDAELVWDLEEVVSLRDVVAHGHLWEARTVSDATGLHFAEPPYLDPGWFGDSRFWSRVIDPRTRKSRRLNLNLYPLRIWRRDGFLSFRTVVRALVALEPYDPTGLRTNSAAWEFDFGDDHISLAEIADRLVVPDDV